MQSQLLNSVPCAEDVDLINMLLLLHNLPDTNFKKCTRESFPGCIHVCILFDIFILYYSELNLLSVYMLYVCVA